MHVLEHWLGMDDPSGRLYLFLSGAGTIIIPWVTTTLPVLWVLLRKHNCHVHRCWRVGRHPVGGTLYVVCRHHHPQGAPTHHRVIEANRRSRESD